jgi:hypothetical protein
MNPALVFLMFFVGLFLAVVVWFKLRPDPVGKLTRVAKEQSGIHGRVDEWLYWRAEIGKPALAKVVDPSPDPPDNPWLRALQAVVREEAHRSGLELQAARDVIVARQRTALTRAFMRGKIRAAVAAHARSLYRGPGPLFYPWFYFVAYPRFGRRYLFLDTIAHALREIRTQ